MAADFTSFQEDVLQASHAVPVLVDFWAEWCGPCRMLGPTLERLVADSEGQWQLVKINVDEYPEIAQEHKVQGIPSVKLFHQGRQVAEFAGALQESEVRQWLETYMPSELKQMVEAARLALAEDRGADAEPLLDRVLAEDPSDVEARVLLARLRFHGAPEEAIKLVEDVQPGDPLCDTADAIRTLFRLKGLSVPEDAGNPEAWKLYLQGARAAGECRYADALEDWIEVLSRRARDVDEDGARKACIAVFRLLSEDHAITQQYRRPFSSAVF
jgi:putative thioredoxin